MAIPTSKSPPRAISIPVIIAQFLFDTISAMAFEKP